MLTIQLATMREARAAARLGHAGLRLITCGRRFDNAAGHYEDNIVVYAALVCSHALEAGGRHVTPRTCSGDG